MENFENKTKEQLIKEIEVLNKRVLTLEREKNECKQIEEELAKIAAEQKNIMGTISDGIYMLDMSGNLVNWNTAAEVVSGLSAKELTGKPVVELFAEKDRADVAEAIRKGLEEGTGEVTGSFLRKDRSPAIYQWSTVPLKDPQGKVIGLTGVGRDITERKRIEEELARIAAEQKNIMGTISDGVYMLDMSGNLVNWNKAAETVSGLSAKELTGKPAVELFAKEDRAAVAEAITKGLKESIGEVTGSFLRKDRSPAIYQWSTVPLKDPQGKVVGLTGVGRNITEQKRIEEELARIAAEQKNIMGTISDGIYMLDMHGNLVNWNKAAETVTGLSAGELTGKPAVELFAEKDRAAVAEAITKGLKEGIGEVTGSFLRKDRSPAIYQWSTVPLKDPQGKVVGLTGVGRDITERKKAEEELTKHREHLEEIVKERTEELEEKNKKLEKSQQSLALLLEDVNESRAELEKRVSEVEQLNNAMVNLMEDLRTINKNLETTTRQLGNANKELEAFSYSVSHDLRAPLRAADSFSQILLEEYSDTLDKKAKHYLERVRAGAQNMAQLIDDILNLSRIGRQSMEKKEINVETVAGEAYESLELEWRDRKVNFTVHQCPPARTDLNLMQIVFMNLLSNALKFTRNRTTAEIEVGCETRDEQTVFFVKDNGTGFDMKYADKLFAPFQRLHHAEEYEGTGIGLAIVQRIIHRHSGQIWVESKLDKGTTFHFTLE